MTTKEDAEKFARDGFVVIENFATVEECEAMMAECRKLVDDMKPEEHNTVFDAIMDEYGKKMGVRDMYFINSQDKIGFFFDEEARDKKGNLVVPKHLSLNKIGHAMHVECPTFRKFTFSDKMKAVVKNCGLVDPVVTQSMYIFKQPRFGAAVKPHQDASYLHTDPLRGVMGVWLALEDATLDNGCLWFVPGSHKSGLVGDYRLIRNPAPDGPACIYNEDKTPEYPGEYIPVPIKRGSMILIDGLVYHKSEKNTSEISRNIYTFHVYDAAQTKWSDNNWLQPTEAKVFQHMNDVQV